MTYSTVVISVFFTMTVLGVILLRLRRPALLRPYKTWGYPITPLVYSLAMIGFIINVCAHKPLESLFGFGLLALGIPVYLVSRVRLR